VEEEISFALRLFLGRVAISSENDDGQSQKARPRLKANPDIIMMVEWRRRNEEKRKRDWEELAGASEAERGLRILPASCISSCVSF
jgi:hypothetical protein